MAEAVDEREDGKNEASRSEAGRSPTPQQRSPPTPPDVGRNRQDSGDADDLLFSSVFFYLQLTFLT